MDHMRTGIRYVAWLTTLLFLAFVIQSVLFPEAGADKQRRYTDPFAYCSAVGTIDAPDARYAGPKVPLVIAHGLRRAFQAAPDAPLAPFIRNSFWRCMGGKVYACTVGANLPCQEKTDISRVPNQGMVTFCQENPDSDVIPAVAAGRATVYLWRCKEGMPQIVRQVARPDARGYLSHIWHQIEPETDP